MRESLKGPGNSGAFAVSMSGVGVNMRKPVTVAAAATSAAVPAGRRDRRAVELICLTLALAMLAIIVRIASIW